MSEIYQCDKEIIMGYIPQLITCYKPGSKIYYNEVIAVITAVTLTPTGYYYTIDWINNGCPYSTNVYECQIESTCINTDSLETIGFK